MKPDDFDPEWEECPECGGEGYVSRYEEDPLWYDEDEEWPCELCGGDGGYVTRPLSPRGSAPVAPSRGEGR